MWTAAQFSDPSSIATAKPLEISYRSWVFRIFRTDSSFKWQPIRIEKRTPCARAVDKQCWERGWHSLSYKVCSITLPKFNTFELFILILGTSAIMDQAACCYNVRTSETCLYPNFCVTAHWKGPGKGRSAYSVCGNHRRFWLRLRHAVILMLKVRTSASKKINLMALIRTLTIWTTTFERMKEKFYGFRQTVLLDVSNRNWLPDFQSI